MPESRDKLKKSIVIGIMSLMAIYLAVYIVLSPMSDYVVCGKDHDRTTALFYVFLPVYLVDIQWGNPQKDGWVPAND